MKLVDLQHEFWRLATQAPDAVSQHSASRVFVDSEQLSAASRIAIYADMFVWRQVDCLREDYPKLAEIHEDFYALASSYLAEHPSRHHSLAQLGHALPEFLSVRPASRADASDLAALEWARIEAFDEADAPTLAQLTGSDSPLRIVPAFRALELEHDVLAVWQAVEDGTAVPEPRHDPCTVVVWRKAYDVFHVRLEATEAIALRRAMGGADLALICEAFERHADPVGAAYRAIGSWFTEGWIADTN